MHLLSFSLGNVYIHCHVNYAVNIDICSMPSIDDFYFLYIVGTHWRIIAPSLVQYNERQKSFFDKNAKIQIYFINSNCSGRAISS